jgi:hypothetical protein
MFFIREENVRPGNRGGRNLFNWNDVRLMNNKDRESYLGVTQSIGFLDKGGKWRKRDWWQDYDPKNSLDNDELAREREFIKKEEERLIRESINGKDKTTGPKREESTLTDYEFKEMMKKESTFANPEHRPVDFYENDEHKPGLGVKANISFRTNPYDKKSWHCMSRLGGVNYEDKDIQPGKKDLSRYVDASELEEIKKEQSKVIIDEVKNKEHRDNRDRKNKKYSEEKKKDRKDREYSEERREKKDRKDRKDKKKHKNRSRSRSRSHKKERKH